MPVVCNRWEGFQRGWFPTLPLIKIKNSNSKAVVVKFLCPTRATRFFIYLTFLFLQLDVDPENLNSWNSFFYLWFSDWLKLHIINRNDKIKFHLIKYIWQVSLCADDHPFRWLSINHVNFYSSHIIMFHLDTRYMTNFTFLLSITIA